MRIAQWISMGIAAVGQVQGGEPPATGATVGEATFAPPPVLLAEAAPERGLWVDALDFAEASQDWGRPQAAKSVDQRALLLGAKKYPHGIGTHANSEIVVQLGGDAERFQAVVGVDDEVPAGRGSVIFALWLDERELFRSPVLRSGSLPLLIDVDARGAKEMTLLVEDGGDSIDSDHADWAGGLLTLRAGASFKPRVGARPNDPPPAISLGQATQPEIHAPRIACGTPGRDFHFRIPASGAEPLRYYADGLPAGLTIDSAQGVIRGVLGFAGEARVRLCVENDLGAAHGELKLVAGADALALTPPMGWNSWNVWGTAVDDAKVRAAADWLVRSGLAAHGFQYINIDDAWEGQRDASGRIQSNEKFPDMRALAEYVHAKGLRLGIYSGPGRKTCANYEASLDYEFLDAQQWADWGIDLIKYDWCSYRDQFKLPNVEEWRTPTIAEYRKPYELMRLALDATGRDIVFSICQYGMGDVWQWGDAVGGTYWRTTGDITDSWSSMSGIGFAHAEWGAFVRPGHWNDPDMLVLGMVGWGPTLHATHLTPHEQVTHMTLWSLLAAPLLIGCDLSQMDEFTAALLTNPEVLAVDQDELGIPARRVALVDGGATRRTEVWARPLADGRIAVGLFNRGVRAAKVRVTWDALGLGGTQRVRDLWLRRDVGVRDGAYEVDVARHGAAFVMVSPASAPH